jgi:hypothetical protein
MRKPDRPTHGRVREPNGPELRLAQDDDAGHHRGPDPSRDQRQHAVHLAPLGHERGFEPGLPASGHRGSSQVIALAKHDQGHASQVAYGHPPAPREAMLSGNRKHELFLGQCRGVEVLMADGEDHESKVQLASLKPADEVPRPGLYQLEANPRIPLVEAREHGGNKGDGQTRRGAQGKLAVSESVELPNLGNSLVDASQYVTGERKQHPPGGSQARLSRAPVEQLGAELGLQPSDLGADRGLGHRQARRGPGEVAFFCHRHEVRELMQLDMS